MAPNQRGKLLAILSSFTATCQQIGIYTRLYLRGMLTELHINLAVQRHGILQIN